MDTILRTRFGNMISMKTQVIWTKFHWCDICSQESNEQYACICPASFKCFFFKLWLQIRFPLKCHCKEIYHFMNAHILAFLISWVCIYKYDLFISIYILRRKKFIHTYTWQCPLVLRYCVSHLSVFFSIDEIKIFIVIVIYELIATGWRIHVSRV